MESISVKLWPLTLGSSLSLSSTVPGDIICAFATTYKPAVVEVHTIHTSGPLFEAEVINVPAIKYKL